MSISVLDDAPPELVKAMKNSRKRMYRAMGKVKGSEDFKRGYRAYLEGFDLTDYEKNAYTMYQGDYLKGYEAAKKEYPDLEKFYND